MNVLANTYLIVALIAGLLCIALACNAWRRRNVAHGYLAAWLATRVSVLILTAIETQVSGFWNDVCGQGTAWLTTLSGPLLLAYVSSAANGRTLGAWAYAPAAAHLLVIPWVQLSVADCMPLTMVYALAAVITAWQRRFQMHPSVRRELGYVLSAIATMHCVNLLILTVGDYVALEGVLLAIGFGWAIAAVLSLLTSSLIQLKGYPQPEHDGASAEHDEIAYRRIVRIVESEQLWRDCDLGLTTLAHWAGHSETELSRLLNRFNEGGFYAYLNRLRSDHLCALLSDPEQARYTIEGLGRESGFATRSTMYRVFKDRTGKTPSEFRRTHATTVTGKKCASETGSNVVMEPMGSSLQ